MTASEWKGGSSKRKNGRRGNSATAVNMPKHELKAVVDEFAPSVLAPVLCTRGPAFHRHPDDSGAAAQIRV